MAKKVEDPLVSAHTHDEQPTLRCYACELGLSFSMMERWLGLKSLEEIMARYSITNGIVREK